MSLKRLLILVLSMLLVAGATAVGMRLSKTESHVGGGLAAEAEGNPSAPGDYFTLKWSSNRQVTPAQVARAKSQADAIPQGSKAGWQLVGPSNVGARVVDLVVDPNNPDTMYTAVSGGGVWKSTDGGATFQPAWPNDQTQTMGALAMGSDGTLWAGTGEANPSGGGLTYFGDGVYKSTDGGASWQHWGLTNSAAKMRCGFDGSIAMSTPPVVSLGGASTSFQSLPPFVTR